MIKLGLDKAPVDMPKGSATGVFGLEILIGIFLAWRGVRTKI